MTEEQGPSSLSEVVDRIAEAGDGDSLALADLLNAVGERAYGPMLLVPSLILVSPLSGIPGLPSLGGLVIALIAGHLVLGRRHVWLPDFLLRRRIGRQRLEQAVRFMRPPVRVIDRLVKRRLAGLTEGPFARLIGAICLVIALLMPVVEVLPLLNSITAAAIAVFALALTASDGALALVALAITAGSLYLVSGLVV